jgi:RimJ/RimL family protein N-acetyltransferase
MTDKSPLPPSRSAQAPHWVPIRALAPRHRPRVLQHLLALSPQDRYWRFGQHTGDAQIERYVEHLDFERDEIFGIFNRRLQLIAMAHLAHDDADADATRRVAEFGVSVLPHARGRGLAARLFDRATLHARNRLVDTMLIQSLTENEAMLRIVRNAGARVERSGAESLAVLALPAHTPITHLEAALERQAAEFDFNWKRQSRRVTQLLGRLSRIRDVRHAERHETLT